MGRGVLIITEWSIIIPNWHLTLEQNEATKSIQNMPSSCVGCVWTWKDHYICGATCYRNIARLCSCHAMWWAAGPFLPVSALLCSAVLCFIGLPCCTGSSLSAEEASDRGYLGPWVERSTQAFSFTLLCLFRSSSDYFYVFRTSEAYSLCISWF